MSHVTKLIPETQELTPQQKVMGEKRQTNWLTVHFEFDNPVLKPNNYPPPDQQLNWGCLVNGVNMPWFITQKSVESLLNAIGPMRGTEVRVAKIRTGPQPVEIEYEIEYVSGPTNPRDIRAELTAQQPQQAASQPTAQPQVTPSPNGPAPGPGRTYTRLSDHGREVYIAAAGDNLSLYWDVYDLVSEGAPEDWTTEDKRTLATSISINTQRHLGNDLSQWSVEEAPVPPPPPGQMTLDQLQQTAIGLLQLPTNQYVADLFDLLVEAHPHTSNEHQVRAILKNKLGYENLPKQDDVLASLVHEYMVYCTARDEGKTDVEACDRVHEVCGRDKSLMLPVVEDEKEEEKEILI